LPATWSGGDPDAKNDLDAAVDAKLTTLQDDRNEKYRGDRSLPPGGMKTQPEIDEEANDPETIRLAAREWTLNYAKKEFYGRDDNLDGNPWHDSLKYTMFWM
jgi:hypothetical protein